MGLKDLGDRLFNHGDAVRITRISSKDLNNWTQRGLVEHIGKMERSGRRMYSAIDLIALRVIGDLAQRCAMTPSFAAAMSENVKVQPARVVMTDPKTGDLRPVFAPAPQDQEFILAWIDGDKFRVEPCTGRSLLTALATCAFPVNVVPVDAIASEVVTTAIAALGEEQ